MCRKIFDLFFISAIDQVISKQCCRPPCSGNLKNLIMWVITAKMTKDHCGFRNTGLENSDKLGAVTNYANRRKLNHRSSYTSSLGQVFVAVKSEKVAFIFDDSCIYAQEIAYMRTFDCERLDTTYFRLCSLGQRPRFSTLPPPIDFGHCGTWLQSRNQLGTPGGAQIF